MPTIPTQHDADLILRLYEMRRDPLMRRARAWYIEKFTPKTMEELMTLCAPGSEESAFYRMVTSYWEMVASFLNSGVLNQELFYKSGNEMLFTYLRLSRLLPEIRTLYKDPLVADELETAAEEMITWRKSRSAEGMEMFRKRVQGE